MSSRLGIDVSKISVDNWGQIVLSDDQLAELEQSGFHAGAGGGDAVKVFNTNGSDCSGSTNVWCTNSTSCGGSNNQLQCKNQRAC